MIEGIITIIITIMEGEVITMDMALPIQPLVLR